MILISPHHRTSNPSGLISTNMIKILMKSISDVKTFIGLIREMTIPECLFLLLLVFGVVFLWRAIPPLITGFNERRLKRMVDEYEKARERRNFVRKIDNG